MAEAASASGGTRRGHGALSSNEGSGAPFAPAALTPLNRAGAYLGQIHAILEEKASSMELCWYTRGKMGLPPTPACAACEACTTDVRAPASLTQVYNRHCVLYEDTHKQLVSVHLPWLRALRRLRRVACRNGGDGAPRSTTTSRRLTISVLTAAAITTATTTHRHHPHHHHHHHC